eukprot:TRINITY_DN2983_c0_g5_i1.p1 TRINITY_DN2983_c0_g5~~TRINITY_DN2983_c0_g5_i1.p1  ORF type:complete len:532 (+),score=71.79 TRINITY_DN2983_c0_g5_i1:217-1812(+)
MSRCTVILCVVVPAIAKSCSFEASTDFQGYDIAQGEVTANSADECCAICGDKSSLGCRFWTFMPPLTCYMKYSDKGRRRAGEPAVPAVVGQYTSGSTIGGSTCSSEASTDMQGYDISSGTVSANSPDECCAACDDAAGRGCLFWTFMPPFTCYMKYSDAGRRRADDPGSPPVISQYTSGSIAGVPSSKCNNDWDCSLAGECRQGRCICDAWTSGADCSYLNLLPVNRSRIGYVDERHTSWGGNAVLGSDGQWHLYAAEIACNAQDTGSRCGLSNWESTSQVVHAVSPEPDGPYIRRELTLPQMHHNPTLKVSPVDKTWHLYSIRAFSGPVVLSSSTDEGKSWTWTTPGVEVSRYQNPGPILHANGSMTMFYRDNFDIPEPTCSKEGIGVQHCASPTSVCEAGGSAVFRHTAEDPSVFIDHRGNWHMLMNALPYLCSPKFQQGGHAWSRDGISWSEPRVGAFNTTVHFSDGTSLRCGRRERPQMVLDADGVPLVFFSAVTNCPVIEGTPYKGGDDSFTLAQMVHRPMKEMYV